MTNGGDFACLGDLLQHHFSNLPEAPEAASIDARASGCLRDPCIPALQDLRPEGVAPALDGPCWIDNAAIPMEHNAAHIQMISQDEAILALQKVITNEHILRNAKRFRDLAALLWSYPYDARAPAAPAAPDAPKPQPLAVPWFWVLIMHPHVTSSPA